MYTNVYYVICAVYSFTVGFSSYNFLFSLNLFSAYTIFSSVLSRGWEDYRNKIILTNDVIIIDSCVWTNRFRAEVFDATFENGAVSRSDADISRCLQEHRVCVVMPSATAATRVAIPISRRRSWPPDSGFRHRRCDKHTAFLSRAVADIMRRNKEYNVSVSLFQFHWYILIRIIYYRICCTRNSVYFWRGQHTEWHKNNYVTDSKCWPQSHTVWEKLFHINAA